MELLALLPDRPAAERRLEFYAQPQIHLSCGHKRARGHAEGFGLLCCLYAPLRAAWGLPCGNPEMERISGDGPQHAPQFRNGIPVPAVFCVRQKHRQRQAREPVNGARSKQKLPQNTGA